MIIKLQYHKPITKKEINKSFNHIAITHLESIKINKNDLNKVTEKHQNFEWYCFNASLGDVSSEINAKPHLKGIQCNNHIRCHSAAVQLQLTSLLSTACSATSANKLS